MPDGAGLDSAAQALQDLPAGPADQLGVGTDVVSVGAFARQLALAGTRFGRVFGRAEQLYLNSLPGTRRDASAAARWAAKEAVVKAWSALLVGLPPVIPPDRVNWADVQVARDRYGRPYIALGGEFAAAFQDWLERRPCPPLCPSPPPGHGRRTHSWRATWRVSLSHEGDVAIAVVALGLAHTGTPGPEHRYTPGPAHRSATSRPARATAPSSGHLDLHRDNRKETPCP